MFVCLCWVWNAWNAYRIWIDPFLETIQLQCTGITTINISYFLYSIADIVLVFLKLISKLLETSAQSSDRHVARTYLCCGIETWNGNQQYVAVCWQDIWIIPRISIKAFQSCSLCWVANNFSAWIFKILSIYVYKNSFTILSHLSKNTIIYIIDDHGSYKLHNVVYISIPFEHQVQYYRLIIIIYQKWKRANVEAAYRDSSFFQPDINNNYSHFNWFMENIHKIL